MTAKKIWWYRDEGPNTGDLVTPWLFDKFGLEYEFSNNKEFIGAGSIFQRANKNTLIWGSGVHKINDIWPWDYDINKVYAVRGKLTYDLLKTDRNIVLGDPGLLVGAFYKTATEKKYKCCILAHYTEYRELSKFARPDFPVYNMMVDGSNPLEWLLDRISECECVISTSLHGLVFAHSLGIPAVHLNFTNLYNANAFKFKDYYSVFNSIQYSPIVFSDINNAVNDMLENPHLFRPDESELKDIQTNLLRVFPYEISWNKTKAD